MPLKQRYLLRQKPLQTSFRSALVSKSWFLLVWPEAVRDRAAFSSVLTVTWQYEFPAPSYLHKFVLPQLAERIHLIPPQTKMALSNILQVYLPCSLAAHGSGILGMRP